MSYHFPPRNKELCMRSSLEKIICELGKFDTVNLNCRAFTHIFLFIKKSRIIRNPVLYSFAYTEMSYLYTQVAHLSSTAPSIVAALLFHHYVSLCVYLLIKERSEKPLWLLSLLVKGGHEKNCSLCTLVYFLFKSGYQEWVRVQCIALHMQSCSSRFQQTVVVVSCKNPILVSQV